MKQTLTLLAILALGLTACNKVELQNSSEKIPEIPAEAPVCYFNLPASFIRDDATKAVTIGENTATTTFADTDKVYVVIEHNGTRAIAYDPDEDKCVSMTVTPDANPATATLGGALTFYYDDGGTPTALTPAADDVVYLFYNINSASYPADYLSFNYIDQNGSLDQSNQSGFNQYYGVTYHDYAQAKMKITAVSGDFSEGYTMSLAQYDDPTKSYVRFQNVGSLFRQNLSFKDKNGDSVTPTLSKFTISTSPVKTIYQYIPFIDLYLIGPIRIDNPQLSAEGNIYFAMMFNDDNKNETLYMTAEDVDGNVYTASKAAPAVGFDNGKYYYGSLSMTWQKCIKPTVTGTSATPNDGYYVIPENPVNLTISGSSEDYYFELSHGGTVTLDNLTATSTSIHLDASAAEELQLVLMGANSIIGDSFGGIINADAASTLKLSCTGASATLTVTDTSTGGCGIKGCNYRSDGSGDTYNYSNITTQLDVTTQLAAPGFVVTRSARTDNADGSYTWTYTVEDHRVHLNSLTSSYTAQDGDVLTGELPGNLELNIAAGATVTLAGMTHHAGKILDGIMCKGSVNIILAAGTTNDLTRGDQDSYSGIFVDCLGPATLTISGTGTLLASGGGHGPGIGVTQSIHDIVINGGNITATGDSNAPGIGSCYGGGTVGNIAINGGTVTAIGGSNAVGIGAAAGGGTCAGVTIGSDITSVSIRRGSGSAEFFSAVSNPVTIDGKTTFSFTTSTTQFPHLDSTLSTTTDTNDTWTLTHK